MRRGSIKVESVELKQMNDDLRREMEEIRCSSRGELLRAWEEMEQLEDEKDDLKAENFGLKHELEAARKREEELLEKIKALEAGTTSNTNIGKKQTGGGKGKRDGRRSFTFGTFNSDKSLSLESLQDSKRSLISDKEMLEQQMARRVELIEKEREEMENEWKYKLQCRELVLDSLEKTTVIQGESIEKLQQQLDEQDKDKNSREEKMKRRIKELNQKVDEKRKIIAKQEKKMRRFRSYIEDLTGELQRVTDEDRRNISRKTSKYSSSISLSSKETATSKETVSDDDNIPLVHLERKNSCVPASA